MHHELKRTGSYHPRDLGANGREEGGGTHGISYVAAHRTSAVGRSVKQGQGESSYYSYVRSTALHAVLKSFGLPSLGLAPKPGAAAAAAAAAAAKAPPQIANRNSYWPAANQQHGAKELRLKEMGRNDAYHDPTNARVVAMNFAICDQSLNGISGLKRISNMPNYDLMYPSEKEHLADSRLRDNTGRYYKDNRHKNSVRFSALNCIRAAEGTAVVVGTVLEGKRLIDLADNITAVPSLSTDDISAYAFVRNTGELVEQTEELRQELRAALGPNAPAGAAEGGAAHDDDNNIDENGNDGHRARTRARTRTRARAQDGEEKKEDDDAEAAAAASGPSPGPGAGARRGEVHARASAAGLGGGTGEEEEQDEEDDEGAGVNDDDYSDDDGASAGAGAGRVARGNRAGGTGRRRGGAPTRGGAGAGGAGRGGGAHARGDGDEQLSNGDEDDAEESSGEMLFGGIIRVKRLDHYTPTIRLLLCYGWLCPRLLDLEQFQYVWKTPGYEGLRASHHLTEVDNTAARDVVKKCWKDAEKGRKVEVRPRLFAHIRGAHAAAAVPGGPPLPPAVVGKALIDLVCAGDSVTAVPFLGSDNIEDYSL